MASSAGPVPRRGLDKLTLVFRDVGKGDVSLKLNRDLLRRPPSVVGWARRVILGSDRAYVPRWRAHVRLALPGSCGTGYFKIEDAVLDTGAPISVINERMLHDAQGMPTFEELGAATHRFHGEPDDVSDRFGVLTCRLRFYREHTWTVPFKIPCFVCNPERMDNMNLLLGLCGVMIPDGLRRQDETTEGGWAPPDDTMAWRMACGEPGGIASLRLGLPEDSPAVEPLDPRLHEWIAPGHMVEDGRARETT